MYKNYIYIDVCNTEADINDAHRSPEGKRG